MATVTRFVINTEYTFTFNFTDLNGTAVSPTTVTFTSLDPSGSTAALTPTNPATGQYVVKLTPNSPGLWKITGKGTGALVAHLKDQSFWVEDSFAR